jgi:radical SAM/Cys-rich protein
MNAPADGNATIRAYDFDAALETAGLDLTPQSIDILQLNVTKLCNQACRHCHVDASPARTEAMTRETIEQCLRVLEAHPQIGALDITGGAPELHPDFEFLVEQATALGRHVMVRHNLTVQLDGHPVSKRAMDHLPAFFAQHKVEVISSLPYYQQYFTDAQRGGGVFKKSIEAMRRLNAVGYGIDGSGLIFNLVYNPVGPYLPAAQSGLEAEYKKHLQQEFGLHFSGLFTITNMPIHRFKLHLQKSGQYAAYMDKLTSAFNPAAAAGVMCRALISVDHTGALFDCDFNQQLGLTVRPRSTIFEFDYDALMRRRIRFEDHCFGCTAGAGSSCGGATA